MARYPEIHWLTFLLQSLAEELVCSPEMDYQPHKEVK